ncbi:hypothetical protein M8J76_001791 [Diaphorina citri]|nr:hypothetical protein M8J75_008224 [Diaphorina citri]KAI5723140.1 hypothetical protein M8J76_001791 [Diaphorina citri]KAI5728471.1 hypothetical protein M8J77_016631 [Diaphorina citri]
MNRPDADTTSVDIVEEEVEDYENRTRDYRNAIYTIQYNDVVAYDNNHTDDTPKQDGANHSRTSSQSDAEIEGRRRVRFSDAGVAVHEVPGRPRPNKCWRNTKRCLDYFCCCGCLFPRI